MNASTIIYLNIDKELREQEEARLASLHAFDPNETSPGCTFEQEHRVIKGVAKILEARYSKLIDDAIKNRLDTKSEACEAARLDMNRAYSLMAKHLETVRGAERSLRPNGAYAYTLEDSRQIFGLPWSALTRTVDALKRGSIPGAMLAFEENGGYPMTIL